MTYTVCQSLISNISIYRSVFSLDSIFPGPKCVFGKCSFFAPKDQICDTHTMNVYILELEHVSPIIVIGRSTRNFFIASMLKFYFLVTY